MRPNFPETSSDGTIIYSTDVIRQVAGKIIASVGVAQPAHDSTWNTIQSYLNGDNAWLGSGPYRLPLNNGRISTMEGPMPDVYYYVKNVLEPHATRLRTSFDLQLQVAEALFALADQIDEAEQKISDGFQTDSPPPPPVTHGPTP